jgi:hypothetical protein
MPPFGVTTLSTQFLDIPPSCYDFFSAIRLRCLGAHVMVWILSLDLNDSGWLALDCVVMYCFGVFAGWLVQLIEA